VLKFPCCRRAEAVFNTLLSATLLQVIDTLCIIYYNNILQSSYSNIVHFTCFVYGYGAGKLTI